MAFPPVLRGGGSYTDIDDPDAFDPTQAPAQVPMTFVIVNGQRIPVPVGESQGDELGAPPDKPPSPPPPLRPDPTAPAERPPVIQSPFAVMQAPSAALARGLTSLTQTPGNLANAAQAAASGLGADIVKPTDQITSPSKELQRQGVNLGLAPSLMLDVATDPTNLIGGGGNPVLDAAHLGVGLASGAKLGMLMLPHGAQALKGFASRLLTHVLPLIPTKGWSGERILSKIAGGLASKEELALTGIGDWLRSNASRPIPRAELEQVLGEKALPLYERWYGHGPGEERLVNAASEANADRLTHRRWLGRGMAEEIDAARAQGPVTDQQLSDLVDRRTDGTPDHRRSTLARAKLYVAASDQYEQHSAQLKAATGSSESVAPLWGDSYALPGGTNRRELTIGLGHLGLNPAPEVPYKVTSVHKYQDPNMLAHVRLGDYVTDDGKKVLLIEESQSDAHDAARAVHESIVDDILRGKDEPQRMLDAPLSVKENRARELASPGQIEDLDKAGYGVTGDAKGKVRGRGDLGGHVPNIPFKGSDWQRTVMQRMLSYAAEHGYDEIAWTTGLQQSDRYNVGLRDVVKMEWTGDNRVVAHMRNGRTHELGPYNSFKDAARDIGDDAARRLEAAVPPDEVPQVFSYKVFDKDDNLVATREFPTAHDALTAANTDRVTYHPEREAPTETTEASWDNLSSRDQERVRNHWYENVQDDSLYRDDAHDEVRTSDWYDGKVQEIVDKRIKEEVESELSKKGLPTDDEEAVDLDTPTWSRLGDDTLANALTGELWQPQFPQTSITPTRQPSTIRDTILNRVREELGLDLDPASLDIKLKGEHSTSELHGPYLRTADDRSLSLNQQHDVNKIAKETIDDVEEYVEHVKQEITTRIESENSEGYSQEASEEFENDDDYYERVDDVESRLQNEAWHSLDDDERLEIARNIGDIEGAHNVENADPTWDPNAPENQETGWVSTIDYPPVRPNRVIDLSDNPLTMSSKGMVQQYDKNMVDIGTGLGKKFGVRPRPLEIQAGSATDRTVMKGELHIEKVPYSEHPEGIEYQIKAGDKVLGTFYGSEGEKKAEAELRARKADRTAWAMPLTDEMRKAIREKGFPLMAGVPPAIGTYVWLKSGQRVRVTKVYDDGSFDADPAGTRK